MVDSLLQGGDGCLQGRLLCGVGFLGCGDGLSQRSTQSTSYEGLVNGLSIGDESGQAVLQWAEIFGLAFDDCESQFLGHGIGSHVGTAIECLKGVGTVVESAIVVGGASVSIESLHTDHLAIAKELYVASLSGGISNADMQLSVGLIGEAHLCALGASLG